MVKKNKFVGVLLCLLAILLCVGCQLVVSLVAAIPLGVIVTSELMSKGGALSAEEYEELYVMAYTQAATSPIFLGIVTFGSEALMILAGWLWYRKYKKRDLGIKKAFTPSSAGYLLLTGLACQALITLVMAVAFMILPDSVAESYEALSETLVGATNHPLMVIAVAIGAPIGEELFFRGICLNISRDYFGRKAAIIVSGILFGLFHLGNVSSIEALPGVLVQVAYTTVLGCLLGYFADKYKTLWASIFIHFAINSSAEILSILSGNFQSETAQIVITVIFYIIGAAAAAVVILMKNKVDVPSSETEWEMEQAQYE